MLLPILSEPILNNSALPCCTLNRYALDKGVARLCDLVSVLYQTRLAVDSSAMDSSMSAAFANNPIARRGTKVDIRVGGRNLVGSTAPISPDAFCVVYIQNQSGDANWEEISQSEVKKNNDNPIFGHLFHTEYKFELYQQVQIVVFDAVAGEGAPLKQQHFIGGAVTSLASIISAQGDALELALHKDRQVTSCFVSVSANEVLDEKKEVVIDIFLKGLMTPDEKIEQDEYLAQLGKQLNVPSAAPAVQRRPVASVLSKFQKKEKVPAVRPADIENILVQEEQHREVVQQAIQQVHQAPPPFCPFLVIMTCPEEAIAAHRDWESPEIPWEEVYRSKDVMEYTDLDAGIPLETIRLPQTVLNGGTTNDNQYIKIAVKRTKGDSIFAVGHYITTLAALHSTCRPGEKHDFNMKPTGLFSVTRFEEIMEPSFLDTLKSSNLDMGLIVGIDFTQSNGQPDNPKSLHYQPQEGISSGPNPYEAAIQSVGNLLSAYSDDRRIAAFGFGAKIPPNWDISHCFSLTGDPDMPLCDDVQGLLGHYKNVLPRIQLWGPTMFSEVLFEAKSIVQRRSIATGSAGLAYCTLLIITDGDISDMDKTREELVDLSKFPVSVIIIGVGSENFAKVRTLDDSEGRPMLKCGRELACRRFVQFVDYRSFTAEQGQIDLSRLSETVMGNIPDHVMAYIEYDKKMKAGGQRR